MRNLRIPLLVIIGSIFTLTTGTTTSSSLENDYGNQQELSPSAVIIDEKSIELLNANQYFEILTYWGEEGEYEGIKQLIHLFKENNPQINVVHSATGGGGPGNVNDVLQSRILEGKYPDVFVLTSKIGLFSKYYKPLETYSQLEHIKELFPDQVTANFMEDDSLYGVPLNVHRQNIIWYNRNILDNFDVNPPQSLDELIEVLSRLSKTEIEPFLIDPTSNLLKMIKLSVLGKEFFQSTSKESDFNGNDTEEEHTKINQYNEDILGFVNKDTNVTTWQDASRHFAEGNTAFYMSGDWSKSYLVDNLGMQLNEDFGWIVFPGTNDVFVGKIDAFGASITNNDWEVTVSWMELLASEEGQIQFNIKKGSIPARTDIDMSQFDAYSQQSMIDFKKSIDSNQLIIRKP